MGFPRSRILTVLGVPIMRIYEDSILESTWGSPYLGQMPYLQEAVQKVDHGNKCQRASASAIRAGRSRLDTGLYDQ